VLGQSAMTGESIPVRPMHGQEVNERLDQCLVTPSTCAPAAVRRRAPMRGSCL
jgi:hypothetical protein